MSREDGYKQKFIELPTQSEGMPDAKSFGRLLEMTEANAKSAEKNSEAVTNLGERMDATFSHLSEKIGENTNVMTRLTVTMEYMQAQSAEHVAHRGQLDERIKILENWKSAIGGSIRTLMWLASALGVIVPVITTIIAKTIFGD